jgi:hypothetical protein
MKKLNKEVLTRNISGINLHGNTLGEELNSDANVLVFLRHFG